MDNHNRAHRKRARHKPADKPAAIEELTALHQSESYRTYIERARAAENERRECMRRPLLPTVIGVLREVLGNSVSELPH
jgi:hypothetical protein